MLKRTVVILAAAAFFGGIAPTQTAQARDNMWDLMNPSWWADKMFDNDDDWRYYRYHRYSPYWSGAYVQRPRVIVVLKQPDTQAENPDTRLPE